MARGGTKTSCVSRITREGDQHRVVNLPVGRTCRKGQDYRPTMPRGCTKAASQRNTGERVEELRKGICTSGITRESSTTILGCNATVQ